MEWYLIVAHLVLELCLLTLEVYSFCTCVYYLEKASKFIASKRLGIDIISKGENICDICKRKDASEKRMFKRCKHTFCQRCFIRSCIQLCQCSHCDIAHFECHFCHKS